MFLSFSKGFVNQEAVLTLVTRRLSDFVGSDRSDEGEATSSSLSTATTASTITAVPAAFYGISQGAILGAGYTEFSSLVRHAFIASH